MKHFMTCAAINKETKREEGRKEYEIIDYIPHSSLIEMGEEKFKKLSAKQRARLLVEDFNKLNPDEDFTLRLVSTQRRKD